MSRAMMSGDSPDHARADPLLELKDRPIACTSNGSTSKASGETITASVLVEPRPKPEDAAAITQPSDEAVAKRSRSTSTDDETIESATAPLAPKKIPDDGEALNENCDCTDSDPTKMNHVLPKKEPEEEEEDNCGVKCLYYTLQCCECTIM